MTAGSLLVWHHLLSELAAGLTNQQFTQQLHLNKTSELTFTQFSSAPTCYFRGDKCGSTLQHSVQKLSDGYGGLHACLHFIILVLLKVTLNILMKDE